MKKQSSRAKGEKRNPHPMFRNSRSTSSACKRRRIPKHSSGEISVTAYLLVYCLPVGADSVGAQKANASGGEVVGGGRGDLGVSRCQILRNPESDTGDFKNGNC